MPKRSLLPGRYSSPEHEDAEKYFEMKKRESPIRVEMRKERERQIDERERQSMNRMVRPIRKVFAGGDAMEVPLGAEPASVASDVGVVGGAKKRKARSPKSKSPKSHTKHRRSAKRHSSPRQSAKRHSSPKRSAKRHSPKRRRSSRLRGGSANIQPEDFSAQLEGGALCDPNYRRTADVIIVFALAYVTYQNKGQLELAAQALSMAQKTLKWMGYDFQTVWNFCLNLCKSQTLDINTAGKAIGIGTFSWAAWKTIAMAWSYFEWAEWMVCVLLTQMVNIKSVIVAGAMSLTRLWPEKTSRSPARMPQATAVPPPGYDDMQAEGDADEADTN
jgi:hypothetical protein